MASFHFTHTVCECKKVSLGEILHAVKDNNASTIEQLQDMTDAGTACKCCISKDEDFGTPKMELYLADILKKFNA